MIRREFLTIVSGAAVFAPLSGFAQETGPVRQSCPGLVFLATAPVSMI
jgi:hypothetical protein